MQLFVEARRNDVTRTLFKVKNICKVKIHICEFLICVMCNVVFSNEC